MGYSNGVRDAFGFPKFLAQHLRSRGARQTSASSALTHYRPRFARLVVAGELQRLADPPKPATQMIIA